MLLLTCALFSFVLIGWGVLFTTLLKTELTEGLLNATAFSALVMFFSFLFAVPRVASIIILGLGGLFFIFFMAYAVKKRNKIAAISQHARTIGCYLVLCALGVFISYGLKFRSIDDYSFWGTISKYMFIFNELPLNNDYINASYLTYIPGMASFHYLLYTLANQYSQFLGYFAQGMILISAMMVFFDPKNISRSIAYLSIWLILFILSYGTIFARMEVDAYVASYLFAITWLIYRKGSDSARLIFIPLLFLSIIKEIGLLFALFDIMLLMILEKSNRKVLIHGIGMTFAVLAIKTIWKLHVDAYGLHSFAQAASLKSALAAFNPFNEYYHPVQLLYLKEIVTASFDYLIKLPYLFVYLVIAGLWYWLLKKWPIDKSRVNKLMGLFAGCAIVYLVMLYCLQSLVFDVGHSNEAILGFSRYYNMLFLPWLCMIIFIALEVIKPQSYNSLLKPASVITVSFAFVLLIGGKIERVKKFYQPNNLYALYSLIEVKLPQLKKANWSVCLLNPPKPEYQVTMPLTYFFMPHRVFYPSRKKELAGCDLSLEWGQNDAVYIREERRG